VLITAPDPTMRRRSARIIIDDESKSKSTITHLSFVTLFVYVLFCFLSKQIQTRRVRLRCLVCCSPQFAQNPVCPLIQTDLERLRVAHCAAAVAQSQSVGQHRRRRCRRQQPTRSRCVDFFYYYYVRFISPLSLGFRSVIAHQQQRCWHERHRATHCNSSRPPTSPPTSTFSIASSFDQRIRVNASSGNRSRTECRMEPCRRACNDARSRRPPIRQV
jgi:hypothetical protein